MLLPLDGRSSMRLKACCTAKLKGRGAARSWLVGGTYLFYDRGKGRVVLTFSMTVGTAQRNIRDAMFDFCIAPTMTETIVLL